MPTAEKVLSSIRKISKDSIAPNAGRIDKQRSFPKENLAALGAAGAWGLVIPTASGGAGASLLALAEACEAVGAACSSTAMTFLMHSVTAVTIASGGGAMAGKLVKQAAKGKALGTLAFSELMTGAHFYAPQLKANSANGSVTVSGKKSFVTSGGQADFYVILVQSADGSGADAFIVEKGQPGLKFGGKWEGLGMAGNSSIEMTMAGVKVGEQALVGDAGKAGDLVFGVVAPFFLVGLAAVNVGIAAAACEAAIEHAKGRHYPDGGALAEVQYIQHRLADMDTTTRQARLLVQDAARLGEAGDPGALVAIMEAKVAATDAAAAVTADALRVTGGQGYMPKLPVERLLRDARAGEVMAPTNAVLRTWIGKALAGLPVP